MTTQPPLPEAQALLRRAEEAIGDRCYKCGVSIPFFENWIDKRCTVGTRFHKISDAHALAIEFSKETQ